MMPRTTTPGIARVSEHLMLMLWVVFAEVDADGLGAGRVIGVCAAAGEM